MERIKNFLFKNTNTRQTIVKNTFWIGASTTLIKVFRAGIIIYAARLLGTESYGVFTYAMGIAAMFAVFSDMGISNILVREIAKNTEQTKQYFSTAFVIKVGMLVGMVGLLLGIGPLLSRFDASTTLIPIIALSIVFDSLRSFLYSIPRAQNRMQAEALISILNELFCIALIVFFFFKYPSPTSLAYSFMIGNGIGFLIALFSVRKYIAEVKKYFVRDLVPPLLKLMFPFAVLSVFGIFMTNIDSVIIGLFENEHELGLYGAAQRPMGVFYIIPSFLSLSIFPIISRLSKEGAKEKITTIISNASSAALTIALPLILGGIVVAGPLISVIFGSAYAGATTTFQLLLITVLFVFPGTIFAGVLLTENRQRIFILTGITGAVANIGLNFLLIPTYGIVGSAIATIAAQAAVNTIFYIAVRQTQPIHITRGLYKSLIASITVAVIAQLLINLSFPLVGIILIAIFLYVGLLFVMKDRSLIQLRRSFQ